MVRERERGERGGKIERERETGKKREKSRMGDMREESEVRRRVEGKERETESGVCNGDGEKSKERKRNGRDMNERR